MPPATKVTLGQAIDAIVAALESLDEPARATALRAASEHVGLDAIGRGASTGLPISEDDANVVPVASGRPLTDIRSLKEQKQPKSANEMACIVAYYLDSLAPPAERKAEISAADIEKYFKQGNYKLPARAAQVLVDARGAGYFDPGGRGKYRLNPVGHNLVVHSLPRTKK